MRRSIAGLAGLVFGLLAVVSGGFPVGAQNQIVPVAIAVIGERTIDTGTGAVTVELDGSGSFDPDPGGSIAEYRWEVVTEDYQWVQIIGPDASIASFKVPSEELAARYGPTIEFRLTVTDSGSPSVSASAVVAFEVIRSPDVRISVSARLPAFQGEQIDGYDDDGDGAVDEIDERYTRQGVIHRPGESGNAANEWDVLEGSLLVVDGSGSFDAEGPLPASAFNWERVHVSDVPSVTDTLPDGARGQKTLSTDENLNVVESISSETVGRLPFMGRGVDNSYILYYQLTVTNRRGVSSSQLVKIVIRDDQEGPVVEIEHPVSNPDASSAEGRLEGVLPAGDDRYVISTEAAEEGVTLAAVGAADGSDRTDLLRHTWVGTGIAPSVKNGPGERTTAVFTASEETVEGDLFVITVEVEDPDGLRGGTSVELVVADTKPPTATVPPDIQTFDGANGGYPVSDPPTGRVTLRGVGFDPDGDPLTYQWEQVATASGDSLTRAYQGPHLELDGSSASTTRFTVPEVARGSEYVVYVQFTVTDQWGVSDSEIVQITIQDGGDDLSVIAGDSRRVEPGEFVRLFGDFLTDLVSADAIAGATHTWAYVGIETHPRTEHRPPLTDTEKAQGFVSGKWFPNPDGTYEGDAGGLLNNADSRYPYFDAPNIGEFNSVKLIFELTVGNVVGQQDDSDTIAILILGPYFSGTVAGPDYCANLSLGGPTTYPLDSDDDGVADTCSLKGTRREAVARQNALTTLATLNPDVFAAHLLGAEDDPETPESEALVGTCATAPDDLGDDPTDLADDICALALRDEKPESPLTPVPFAVDPVDAALFNSGIIHDPTYCTNRSLGGIPTYAFDSDDDGVADTCALPYTRREAIARHNALEAAFATHPQFPAALSFACVALGTLNFGDTPESLATDSCNLQSTDSERGNPLPTPR